MKISGITRGMGLLGLLAILLLATPVLAHEEGGDECDPSLGDCEGSGGDDPTGGAFFVPTGSEGSYTTIWPDLTTKEGGGVGYLSFGGHFWAADINNGTLVPVTPGMMSALYSYLGINNGSTLRIGSLLNSVETANQGIHIGGGGGTIEVESGRTLVVAAGINPNGGSTLVKTGAGELRITGGSAIDLTDVRAGTLQIGDGGLDGSINNAVAVAGGTRVIFDRSNNLLWGGTLSGGGELRKRGAGQLTYLGTATHTGGTFLESGSLRVGNGGTAGSLAGDIVIESGAELVFDRADAVTFAEETSGAGAVRKAGAGILTHTGVFGHTGGTFVDAGTLRIGDGGTSGSVAGNIQIAAGASLVFDRAGDTFYDGLISGAGSVTKNSGALLRLVGEQTYTGLTTVNVGTLRIGAEDVFTTFASNIHTAAGTSVEFVMPWGPGFSNARYGGVISGAGGVTFASPAYMNVLGHHTYTGRTRFAGNQLTIEGSLPAQSRFEFAGSFVRFSNNQETSGLDGEGFIDSEWGTFTVRGGGDFRGSMLVGQLIKAGAGQLTLRNAFGSPISVNPWIGSDIHVQGGSLRLVAADLPGSNYQIDEGASLILEPTVDGLSKEGAFDGGGELVKAGSHQLTLSGPLFHTGGTTVEGGTLRLTAAGEFGTAFSLASGATLHLDSALGIWLSGTTGGAGRLVVSGGGGFVLAGAAAHTGGTQVNGSYLSISGVPLAGDLELSDGYVTFNGGGAFAGRTTGPGQVNFNAAGGTFFITGELAPTFVSVEPGTLSIGNGSLTGSLASNAFVSTGATLAFDRANDSTYSGRVDGAGTVTKRGAGRLTLLGEIAADSTRVDAGTLRVGNGGTGGDITGTVVVAAGATFAYDRSDNFTLPIALSGAGTFLKAGSGTLLINRPAGPAATIVEAGTLAVDGAQSGDRLPFGASVQVRNGGTFEIRGVNALPVNFVAIDPTVEAGGTLRIVTGGSAAIGPNGESHVHLRNLTLRGGTVALAYSGNGTAFNNEAFYLTDRLTAAGSAPSSIVDAGAGAYAAIALAPWSVIDVADATGDAASDLTIGARLQNVFNASGALAKEGAGTLELTANNTFTGGTDVRAGTLRVNGSLASALSVRAGATLAGSGSLLGGLNSGGTIAPGNSPGLLTVSGNLTLTDTSLLEMEIFGTERGVSYDSINVSGSITYGGTLRIVLAEEWKPGIGDQFALFGGYVATMGSFSGIVVSSAGYAGDFDPIDGTFTFTAVPEPGTYAIGALLLALVAGRGWRRKRDSRAGS